MGSLGISRKTLKKGRRCGGGASSGRGVDYVLPSFRVGGAGHAMNREWAAYAKMAMRGWKQCEKKEKLTNIIFYCVMFLRSFS